MKERPILFSGEMIRAILAGEKTQTRRVITKCGPYSPTDDYLGEWIQPRIHWGPYGKPGDQLWVREAWVLNQKTFMPGLVDCVVRYSADDVVEIIRIAEERYRNLSALRKVGKKPSIFMPWEFSRIQLQVEAVRVERVQKISEEDALAEGIEVFSQQRIWKYHGIIENFKEVWNSINKDRGYGWDENPWVWVVDFKMITERVSDRRKK